MNNVAQIKDNDNGLVFEAAEDVHDLSEINKSINKSVKIDRRSTLTGSVSQIDQESNVSNS